MKNPFGGNEEGALETSVGHSAAALNRFVQDAGANLIALSEMLQKPTDNRPYVYEVRFDLYPARPVAGLAVVKGFGREGGLIAFHEAAGLVGLVSGLHDRLLAGKLRFKVDDYVAKNYDERLRRLHVEDEYKAAKLPNYSRLFSSKD